MGFPGSPTASEPVGGGQSTPFPETLKGAPQGPQGAQAWDSVTQLWWRGQAQGSEFESCPSGAVWLCPRWTFGLPCLCLRSERSGTAREGAGLLGPECRPRPEPPSDGCPLPPAVAPCNLCPGCPGLGGKVRKAGWEGDAGREGNAECASHAYRGRCLNLVPTVLPPQAAPRPGCSAPRPQLLSWHLPDAPPAAPPGLGARAFCQGALRESGP